MLQIWLIIENKQKNYIGWKKNLKIRVCRVTATSAFHKKRWFLENCITCNQHRTRTSLTDMKEWSSVPPADLTWPTSSWRINELLTCTNLQPLHQMPSSNAGFLVKNLVCLKKNKFLKWIIKIWILATKIFDFQIAWYLNNRSSTREFLPILSTWSTFLVSLRCFGAELSRTARFIRFRSSKLGGIWTSFKSWLSN